MCNQAWLEGCSPTAGFLKFGTDGPFANFYQGLAGNILVDWLYMSGLLGIGVALVLGIAMKLAAWAGALFLIILWTASAVPPGHHPLLDEHLVYAMVLFGLWQVNDRQALGLARWWRKQDIVKQYPILE